MTITDAEIASQPEVWARALEWGGRARELLRAEGERILLIGCGTSAFIARSIAVLRESAGLGMTDSAYASEPFAWRDYDRVVAITRSGTTTEVIDALRRVPSGARTIVITGVAGEPAGEMADDTLVLDFADEKSVVQTRFPTTVLLLARQAFGEAMEPLIQQAHQALAQPLPFEPGDFRHFVFLGHGWTYGLAQEAALKTRESAQAWAEAYPMFDYRHGPLAVAGDHTLVWLLGAYDEQLANDIRATGATVVHLPLDPQVELVQAQRFAVTLAKLRGLNPDTPIHLTRSVVLS